MAGMAGLPNELIAHILGFLDSSSVLEPLFKHKASDLMDEYYEARMPDISCDGSDWELIKHRTHRTRRHLKSASRVNRRWRQAALPHLFRHVLWVFERFEQPEPDSENISKHKQTQQLPKFLAFLRQNNLGRHVDGLTIYVPYPENLIGRDAQQVGHYGILPSTQRKTSGEGFDLATSWGAGAVVRSDLIGHPTWENNWFWQLVLSELDPLRISLISSPAILATMLSRKVFVSSGAAFEMRHQVLSVSRETRNAPADQFNAEEIQASIAKEIADGTRGAERRYSAPPCDNLPCELFSLRPWTGLFVNEGSSLPVFSTETYGDMPPSPFISLLCSEDPSTVYMLTRTLRRLGYVAMVPMATHIQASLYHLVPPRLEELYVQIMPCDLNVKEFSYDDVDMVDILDERDSIYGLLFAGIFIPEPEPVWETLRVFETGDSADEVAWAEAVETVAASSSCWEVERRGKLVRNFDKEKKRRRTGGQPSVLESFNDAVW